MVHNLVFVLFSLSTIVPSSVHAVSNGMARSRQSYGGYGPSSYPPGNSLAQKYDVPLTLATCSLMDMPSLIPDSECEKYGQVRGADMLCNLSCKKRCDLYTGKCDFKSKVSQQAMLKSYGPPARGPHYGSSMGKSGYYCVCTPAAATSTTRAPSTTRSTRTSTLSPNQLLALHPMVQQLLANSLNSGHMDELKKHHDKIKDTLFPGLPTPGPLFPAMKPLPTLMPVNQGLLNILDPFHLFERPKGSASTTKSPSSSG